VHGFGVDDVALDDPLLAPRRAASAAVGLPRLLDELESHGVVDNFRRLGARADPGRRGLWFTDSDLYKWMEAAAWLGPEAAPRLTAVVDAVVAVQRPDGYLNTWYVDERAGQRFTDLGGSHELYCAGHLMQAAVAHHRMAGDRRLLDAAVRFAGLLWDRFGPGGDLDATDGHPGVEMALVELARETGDGRWTVLARLLADRAFGDRLERLSGHAVRMLYLAAGLTDVAIETGDAGLRATVEGLWDDLLTTRTYVTGGVGGRWLGESVGRPYELPNEASYAESCAAVAAALWAARMLALTGRADCADLLERVLCNAVPAAVSVAGDRYFYANPLASAAGREANPWASPWDFQAQALLDWYPATRKVWFPVTCCPPNVNRVLQLAPGLAFGAGAQGREVWVHLLGAASGTGTLADGTGVRVSVEGGYPVDGKVRLTAAAADDGPLTVRVRIPGWAQPGEVMLSVAGAGGGARIRAEPGTYADLVGRGGPVAAELHLDVRPVLVASSPRLAENRGSVAVQRGPVVYAFEGVDNPGVDLLSASIDLRRAPGEERVDDPVLGPVTRVRVGGRVPAGGPGPLYRRLTDDAVDERAAVELVAVPYHQWGNRGTGTLAVWLGRA